MSAHKEITLLWTSPRKPWPVPNSEVIIYFWSKIRIDKNDRNHGKNTENIKSGKIGHIACFSFFPGKNLGAYGDGGAIVTDNKKIYNIISKLHINGAKNKFEYDLIGINSRLDTVQACVLNFKLKRINKLNNLRKILLKNVHK